MTYKTEAPKITTELGHGSGELQRYDHPAFGKVTVSKPCGGGTELFGSALKHQSYVSLTIQTAHLNRELNNDWIHGDKVVLELMMSEHQWAHFVSSAGDGSGTPITFRYRPEDGYRLLDVPGIDSEESMKDTFRREVERDVRKALKDANELVMDLTALVEAGKANKGQLTSALTKLQSFTTKLPAHMGFVQEQFAEAMEKTVESGKTEMEAFVYNLAQRTGLEVLRERQTQLLANKSES